MYKKLVFVGCFLAILSIGIPSFADVNTTRQVLSSYCDDNPQVLEVCNVIKMALATFLLAVLPIILIGWLIWRIITRGGRK